MRLFQNKHVFDDAALAWTFTALVFGGLCGFGFGMLATPYAQAGPRDPILGGSGPMVLGLMLLGAVVGMLLGLVAAVLTYTWRVWHEWRHHEGPHPAPFPV